MFNKWFRPPALDPLSVSMTGAKLGDRVLVIGCSDPHLIAALAAKAGLSGRTCAVDESPDVATEAGRIALKEGVLVETSSAAPSAQPFDRDSFDLVVLRNVWAQASGSRGRWPSGGGACVASRRTLDGYRHAGAERMAALLGGRRRHPPADIRAVEILKGQGFVAVRMLAERDGLRFIEALKKNS